MRQMKLALNSATRCLHSPLYKGLCAIKLYLVQIYQALLFSALDLDIYAGRGIPVELRDREGDIPEFRGRICTSTLLDYI